MNAVLHLSNQIKEDFKGFMPKQRKTQRNNLALLVATMLLHKSANTMELAAFLPSDTERVDMRYQWISRTLANPHIKPDEIMLTLARPLIADFKAKGKTLVLMIDQTTANNGHEILMLSMQCGHRAIPLFWRVKKTEGNIGFTEQKEILDCFNQLVDKELKVVLMGDRFYGTGSLIKYCNDHNWGYRLRMKGNIQVQILNQNLALKDLKSKNNAFVEGAYLMASGVKTNFGFIHEPGHKEPWIIAMSEKPDFYKVLDYGMRWGIESMFSDFKSRGFGLEDTQMRYSDRLSRLILIMAIALYYAVNTGVWGHNERPTSVKKI